MHKIKSVFIESEFSDKQKASSFQEAVAGSLEESWNKYLADWLDKVCPPDVHIAINRLDIQLELHEEEIDINRWNELIIKALKDKIYHEISLQKFDTNDNLSSVSIKQNWLAQWMFFWKSGQLAWNVQSEYFEHIISKELINKNANAIIQQREEINLNLSDIVFFQRCFLSMNSQAFGVFLRMIRPQLSFFVEIIEWLKATYHHLKAGDVDQRETGNFLAVIWRKANEDPDTNSNSKNFRGKIFELLLAFWSSKFQDVGASASEKQRRLIQFTEEIEGSFNRYSPLLPHDKQKSFREEFKYWAKNKLEKLNPSTRTTELLEEQEAVKEEFPREKPKKSEQFEKIDLLVEDAGIVLLHPFLQVLFSEYGIYHQHKSILQSPDKAIQLMHYLVFGESTLLPQRLTTIRFLCGLSKDYVIQEVDLSNELKQECQQLLSSVIHHWKLLKNTSIEGLRVSFLQRKGLLQHTEDHTILKVEKQSYDVLLEYIPWSYNIVKLPWMPEPLYVHWQFNT